MTPDNGSVPHPDKRPCAVCGQTFSRAEMRAWATVRQGVSALVMHDHPQWRAGSYLCKADHAVYRRRYAEQVMQAGHEIGELEREVLSSIETGAAITQEVRAKEDDIPTFGDRMADRVASFGGSWTFILGFVGVLVIWMVLNVTAWLFRPFDLYPFILLNLVLSCVAALQAPVIMMSQRRQEAKDRQRSENDYQINLKAELEIRQLDEKLDLHIARQAEAVAEILRVQTTILQAMQTPRGT